MEQQIKQLLLENSPSLFGVQIEENLIQFQKTRKDVEGDLTLVVFPFVKALKCSPVEAGKKIGDFLLEKLQELESYEVVSGFLNFVVAGSFWLNELKAIDSNNRFGLSEPNSKSALMVEYSSPNTNKPLHLGHLRNNF